MIDDDKLQDLVQTLLIATVEHAYRKCFKGGFDIELFESVKKVEIGDLVMETTTLFQIPRDFKRIGILKSIEGDNYRIKLLNGKMFSWSNCLMIKVDPLLDDYRLNFIKETFPELWE